MGNNSLGILEEAVMLAVHGLGDGAYGIAIRQALNSRTGRDHSLGAIYTTLDRLREKDLLTSWLGDPTAERGGRAKRYFRITDEGKRRLEETLRARQQLSQGLAILTLSGFGAAP